jgi:hypothetical protein
MTTKNRQPQVLRLPFGKLRVAQDDNLWGDNGLGPVSTDHLR